MKFPKLHLACDVNALRPVMACVCVGKEFTFASDAHILVRHKTSEIFKDYFVNSLPEHSILIPSKAVALICKTATAKVSLTEDKKQIQLHQMDGSVIIYRLFEGSYPDANSIIPDPKNLMPINEISISSHLLSVLTDAMDCPISILHLRFFSKTQAIYVTSTYSNYHSVVGIIMPTMINE